MARVKGGEIGKALAKFDEWKAELVEAEEEYDAADAKCDGPDATPEDFEALEGHRDRIDDAIRECFYAADTAISLMRQHGILEA
ncbi:hypothetical protein SEA_YECEY3_82 [Mycobacterium phage Yecey3]|uniref:Uncharacterized protein n=1 Tax=Mycobacterium phage Yecey3 TaxID=2656617 RepID=A0A649VAP3_9CAUD|nr:hypothetical protein KIV58_gp027 [Mycobacterium phage Yecey3]QGJ88833.1 hypothetical protein SEA_YECEY3_82 [Mycobacterium phage Yecey3]